MKDKSAEGNDLTREEKRIRSNALLRKLLKQNLPMAPDGPQKPSGSGPDVNDLRTAASEIISEWVGDDAPEPGDIDYEGYEGLYAERDGIETVDDFLKFLEMMGKDPEDYEALLQS